MAELETGKKNPEKIRTKKQSTRVDFTPMVDLGFLLITFFMLTTSMTKPVTMDINMPTKGYPTPIRDSQSMTVLLMKDHKIAYYMGLDGYKAQKTDFSVNGIRKILLNENRKRNMLLDSIAIYNTQFRDKKISEEVYLKHVRDIKANKDGLIVLIKAADESKYKDLVDIIDEMHICNIGRYAIVDISDGEKGLLDKL